MRRLVGGGADPDDLALVARGPTTAESAPAELWPAVLSAIASGSIVGALVAAPWVGAGVGMVSGLIAAAVQRRPSRAVVRARSYDVVVRGAAIPIADDVLDERSSA